MTAIGLLLWEKELVSGLNGNISVRIDAKSLLLTAHDTCLGLLQEKDILAADMEGNLLEEGSLSTEKLLHTEIYKHFPETAAVIHTHTTFASAYFLENETFVPRIFEAKFYLGEVHSVKQSTPSVTDAGPVVEEFKKNNIVVLRNHGVAAMGRDLFECFLLIQALEEAVKIETFSRLFKNNGRAGQRKPVKGRTPRLERKKAPPKSKSFKLFSPEQMDAIARLANQDKQLAELGRKTQMTFDLAVKLNETGQVYRFKFVNGRIAEVGRDDKAEFLVSAPEAVWRAVFNREIDPFVATTQKKMDLKGDFAKISKWYAPCSRVFELWQKVPIK